jgi:hypothetical protein
VPLYDDVGIRLSGVLSGKLTRYSGCYALVTDETSTPIILVLPRTTVRTENGIGFGPANGGRFVSFGEAVTLRGGYTDITSSPASEFRQTRCKGEAFLVNSVDPTGAA